MKKVNSAKLLVSMLDKERKKWKSKKCKTYDIITRVRHGVLAITICENDKQANNIIEDGSLEIVRKPTGKEIKSCFKLKHEKESLENLKRYKTIAIELVKDIFNC